MKAIYFMAVLVLAIVLFHFTKGSPAPKQDKEASLTGTWYGKYHSENDTTSKTFVIVLREKGKMDFYEGDTTSGDKAKGTFMINGTNLYGNFQFVQDGPVTNIEATFSAANDIMSGVWYCGNDGGKFQVASYRLQDTGNQQPATGNPLTHSATLQPGSPKRPL